MSKKVSASMTLNGTPEEVFAVLTNPEYQKDKNERTGGSNVQVDVDGDAVTVTRELPAPAIAQKITGPTLESKEVSAWEAADSDGNRTGSIKVELGGGKVHINGDTELSGTDTTTFALNVEVKAKVPLIGGKIEADAANEFERAVKAEEKIANEWLAK